MRETCTATQFARQGLSIGFTTVKPVCPDNLSMMRHTVPWAPGYAGSRGPPKPLLPPRHVDCQLVAAKRRRSPPLPDMDNIRPRGNVEITCTCGWSFWVDPLEPRLPGPIRCSSCAYQHHRWIKDPTDPNAAIAVPIDDLVMAVLGHHLGQSALDQPKVSARVG